MKTIFLFLIVMTTFTDTICAQAVGVGTSSPSDALHIVGASNDDPLRVQVGTATKLRVFNNGGTSLGTNNAAGTPANGLYVLGNTGLGVNNPIEKLEVGGNMNIIGEIKANGLAGEQGQLLQSNGNGTMSWIEPCGYQYSEDFFNTTNNPQSWTVPTGVTEIMVEMWGAGGGGSSNYGGGGGGYMKIKRLVTPGEVITFSIGTGGTGNSSSAEATNGSATTFPAGAGWPDHSAGGGSSGTNGLGGSNSLINTPSTLQLRRRGQHGHPKEISYYQISSTDFAQKTSYGDGGIAGFNEVGSGYGGVVIHNTTTNTNITSTIARFGNQPGGGGGGAAGTSSPISQGGAGGDGYVIIYWN